MGERTILVCDVCGEPAAETVTIRVGRRNLAKDLCATHVAELVRGARRPRPGRRKGTVAKPEAARKVAAKRPASTRGRRARGTAAPAEAG